jgi:very-short-patch-repair endonuclease
MPRVILKDKPPKSALEEMLALELKAAGLAFEREYRFHPDRRWRFDFAFPIQQIAVEVEGGTWVNGRHNRASGIEDDMEKYNEATQLGWSVLRFPARSVKDGTAASMTIAMVRQRRA